MEFTKRYLPPDAKEEVGRVCEWIALMAAAGELATACGITRWEKGEAMRGAAACLESWLDGRGTKGSADEEAGVSAVKLYLERYGMGRFWDPDKLAPDGFSPIERVMHERAGIQNNEEFCILPEVFRQEVCKGFDPKAVARALDTWGLLVRDGNTLMTKRRVGKSRGWQYVVKAAILEDGE